MPSSALTTPTGDDEQSVPRSIARVLDLFEIVLAARSCNLTAAAQRSDLTPTTALRYLRALEARGYLDRDESGEYSAGPTILRLAASLRSGTLLDRLTAVAQPHLDQLAETTGESAYLAVGDGRTATYVATAESPRAIRHVGWVGQDVGLDDTALGAALAEPGVVATRTGAIEPDITAMSRALPDNDRIGIAVSVIGPQHRFTSAKRAEHRVALDRAVDALIAELRINGEDFSP
jgi:DNA-binding IclR family transcriptional regulator